VAADDQAFTITTTPDCASMTVIDLAVQRLYGIDLKPTRIS